MDTQSTTHSTLPLYRFGLILLTINSGLYLAMTQDWLGQSPFWDALGYMLLFFGASILYLILITIFHHRIHGWKRLHKGDEKLYSVALILFSVSAHALNLSDIRVFQPYTTWMQGYVLLMHLTVLAFPFRAQLPRWAQYILYFVNGCSVLLAIYLTIFLGPLILFAIPAAILLGLSMHATVPLWFLMRFVASYWQIPDWPWARRAYWIGVIFPVVVMAFSLEQWHRVQQQIETAQDTYNEAVSQLNTDPLYPQWVYIAQNLPDDPLTERVLMSNARTQRSFWSTGMEFLGFTASEFKVHDPLALMAIWLYGPVEISRKDMIKVLEARYDARHMTHRRLWRGNDLATTHIETKVDLFPDFRLAYEEMTLTIHNGGERSWRPQEAVYSFDLPEGAVATSLSLWINGEEQPSRLTTRSKADSAYETIVGVESRDPALLHWQEGNRVTVTIFPCTTTEDRQFKIGFTTPLEWDKDRLRLRNVPFDGPATWMATHDVQVNLPEGQSVESLSLPLHWRKEAESEWIHKGGYQSNWELSFKAPKLNNSPFTFQEHSYRYTPGQRANQPFDPTTIILDINSNWGRWDLEDVWGIIKHKEVYAVDHGLIRLTDENCQKIFSRLRKKRFSMLPLYLIPQPAQTMVISASDGNTPLLSDLDNTPYSRETTKWLRSQSTPLHWVSLTEALPPYVETWRDLRIISVAKISEGQLNDLMATHTFPIIPETDDQLEIPGTSMRLIRDTAQTATDAPDHLFRLFAYQDILRDMGRDFYDREALEEQWVRQAEAAYIVSPISSLVVLESQKDYERFDIDENQNTLGNAAASHAGATPEPHEWVLISLLALVIGLTWWRRR